MTTKLSNDKKVSKKNKTTKELTLNETNTVSSPVNETKTVSSSVNETKTVSSAVNDDNVKENNPESSSQKGDSENQPSLDLETKNNEVIISNTEIITNELDSLLTNLSLTMVNIKNITSDVKKMTKNVHKLIKDSNKKQKKTKQSNLDKPKRAPSGFAKPSNISEELCNFLGRPLGTLMARTEVTKHITQYIKDNELQNPENKRHILPDKKLSSLLGSTDSEEVTYFNLQKYMKHHFPKVQEVV